MEAKCSQPQQIKRKVYSNSPAGYEFYTREEAEQLADETSMLLEVDMKDWNFGRYTDSN